MSDFLTNLTARSLGPAPNLLQPRLPALFEAPKAGGEPGAVYKPGREVDSPTPSAQAERIRREPVRRVETLADDEPASPPELPTPSRILPQKRPFEPLRPQVERPIYTDEEAPSTIVENLPGRQQPIPPPDKIAVPPVTRQRPDDPSTRYEVEPHVITAIFRVDSAQPPSRNGEGDAESPNVSQSLVPRPAIPSKSEQPEKNARESTKPNDELSPEIRPPSDSAPVIRISIGRIDVRAVNSAPPPAARPARRPDLTLDDYLRQRNEGKR